MSNPESKTTAGEYPAIGTAFISDEGILCIWWEKEKVMLAVSADGTAMVSDVPYKAIHREIKLGGNEWPRELHSVMCDDYVATVRSSTHD